MRTDFAMRNAHCSSETIIYFNSKMICIILKSKRLVVGSSDKALPVLNPLQLNVVHNSLLGFTYNASLYLALNSLVEKSINNGP
jgi:hypothetical protein